MLYTYQTHAPIVTLAERRQRVRLAALGAPVGMVREAAATLSAPVVPPSVMMATQEANATLLAQRDQAAVGLAPEAVAAATSTYGPGGSRTTPPELMHLYNPADAPQSYTPDESAQGAGLVQHRAATPWIVGGVALLIGFGALYFVMR